MKNVVLVLLLFCTSICKAQKVIGPSVVTWGGSVGYSFDPNQESYLWGTWVNYEFDKRKLVTPMFGVGILTFNTPQIVTRYFVPQLQVGIVTRNGLIAYMGFTDDKKQSYGLGFYSGYQQFRMEYNPSMNIMSFGCGYVIK
jgi:hypothetical protein